MKKKGVLFLTLFFLLGFSIFVVVFFVTESNAGKEDKEILSLTGSIQFKGEVINSKVYDYSGKPYFMVCVKLDTCNVKSLFIINDLVSIKIKDGIATFPIGVLEPYYGIPVYVEENLGGKGMIKLRYKNGLSQFLPFVLANRGLTKNDMGLCN
ncbi:hypothetical protein [Mucilaginibacter flavus]|uniref:hypothetical protein n=1 Tax=Mucilaginibacter flavus TaxID=931504 RepID=UPI0025B43742|nr:hypothetical protein [Mucilaginibacter flavus]MDN3580543.1 hypothetical protein [Mucilaginibacter flavus]